MQSKIMKCISIFFLIGIVLFSLQGSTGAIEPLNLQEESGLEASKHYVALVTKSTQSAFWKSVFAGANAAGTEYNLTISFQGPENEEDYETQNQMIYEAVDEGAEVIIFSAVDYRANAAAINDAIKAGVEIVVIDSDVDSNQVSCHISTNNYAAGRMAGQAAIELAASNWREQTEAASESEAGSKSESEFEMESELKIESESKREQAAVPMSGMMNIGIVNFDKNSANGQQREAGFREIVEADRRCKVVDAINVLSTTEDAKTGTKQMMTEHPEINVIVTFNEWTSLGVGYAVQELGLATDTTVIAFDSNVVSVGMLETGEVDGLIVQNPYAMGYLGVESAYNLLNDIPIENKNVDTATTLVTRDNMYDEECQRIMFSFN